MRRDNMFPGFTPLSVLNVDPVEETTETLVLSKSEELIAANKEAANTVLHNIISNLPENYITISTAKRIYV